MQYPRVLTLKDGKNETLFTIQDFEYLIDKYMGYDALRFFRSLREEVEDRDAERGHAVSDLHEKLRSLKKTIEELESDFSEQ